MTDCERAGTEAAIRILGKGVASRFLFTADEAIGTGAFCVEAVGDKIKIRACEGVSFLCGLNWYIKHICRRQITWETSLPLQLPEKLPEVTEKIVMKSPYKYRYFLNYCTYSYTMVFWDWNRWEKELDLMALGGVNLALSLVGQEAVIRETLLELGMALEDVERYIPAPVYYAWFFMANMDSFGLQMPEKWYEDRLELAGKIHRRMEELGITPVLPGFYGIVPETLQRAYPDAELVKQGGWCGFSRPAYLSNQEPLFSEMAEIYYRKQKELIGDITPFFTAEPFHEGGRKEGFCLPEYGAAVYGEMQKYRKDAVWVIQGWGQNPLLALFDKIEKKSVLILNLLSARIQDSSCIADDFDGIPWIYCPVHSYGGRNAMYGFLRTMAREPLELLKSQENLAGIGLAPESLETNPVFYDLFWDLTYRREPVKLEEWIEEYAERRYGEKNDAASEAWKLLEDSIYNSFVPQPGGAESFLCARPGTQITSVSTWGPKQVNYDTEYVRRAGKLLYAERNQFADSEHFRYDLVDITRQCLANVSRVLYGKMMYLLEQGRKEKFCETAKSFLRLMKLQDCVLHGHSAFSLGKFLKMAEECGKPYGLEREFVTQAKTLLTVWGDAHCDVLHDYSAREWSGLTGDFYYLRWKTWLERFMDDFEKLSATDTLNLSHDWSEDEAADAEAAGHETDAGPDNTPLEQMDSAWWYQLEKAWIDLDYEPMAVNDTDVANAFAEAYNFYIG